MVVYEWTDGDTRYHIRLDDGIYTCMFWSPSRRKWMWCKIDQHPLKELHRIAELLKEDV